MYFSQRSPTTCAVVSMRRALSFVVGMVYLAAREAPDRDDHFGVLRIWVYVVSLRDQLYAVLEQQGEVVGSEVA